MKEVKKKRARGKWALLYFQPEIFITQEARIMAAEVVLAVVVPLLHQLRL